MSVRPSFRPPEWNNSAPSKRIFMKFYIRIFIESLSIQYNTVNYSTIQYSTVQYSSDCIKIWQEYFTRRPIYIIDHIRSVGAADTSTTTTTTAVTITTTTAANTYLLTPWSRVLLEKLTGLQLVKKFPAFYGIRKFITALTSARHLSLSWASSIQSTHPHLTSQRSILILSSHLRLGLPSGLLSSDVPTKTCTRHPQHTQTGSNSSTIAADSSKGVTNTRCCRYSCMRFWWWVQVPTETRRAVSRYK
jgi:hypothetical protein